MSNLLRAEEVARRCDVATSTVYQWAALGEIPSIRLGEKVVRFREDDIDKWLEHRSRGRDGQPAA